MHHVLLVSFRESLRELRRETERSRDREALPREKRAQLLPRDELHRDEMDSLGFVDLVNGRNVRMVDRRRRLRLLNEPSALAFVRHELGRQDLHRHFAIEPGIEGSIHHSHTAPAELFLDSVMGQGAPDHVAQKNTA